MTPIDFSKKGDDDFIDVNNGGDNPTFDKTPSKQSQRSCNNFNLMILE